MRKLIGSATVRVYATQELNEDELSEVSESIEMAN